MDWWRDVKIWGRSQCIYVMCEMVAEYEAMEPGGQARSLIIPPHRALDSTAEPKVTVLASGTSFAWRRCWYYSNYTLVSLAPSICARALLGQASRPSGGRIRTHKT